MIMKHILQLLIATLLVSCSAEVETGVSRKLAESRKATIKELEYLLDFTIPKSIDEPCRGSVEVCFTLAKKGTVVLDFKAPEELIQSVNCNYDYLNEHLIVDGKEGGNRIKIEFIVPDQSLNRRDEFLYTLLVPDRARTLFPCFDQPNLKAKFTLELTVPENWVGVSNGKLISREGNRLKFSRTEPLSTYLFSIVAGELEQITENRNGREISLYHRETDTLKRAQTGEIFNQVYASIEWLEEYTGIDYPFAKYDLVILPGFQYGGMEHTGATLYADRVMFLNPNPTINEQLARCTLIAHETAHMWFGDYVTMDWFNDVWTKEVFANYFASQITAPQFPDVNHALNFMLSYAPLSYAEDRTEGSNPIQQELDNLQNAGLVYGNIIYKKSPIVMNMLVGMIGEENFRKGIQTYLTRYGFGNATWDNLIEILDELSESDLQTWSDVWIKEKGMPTIEVSGDCITQHDPLGRGLVWGQQVAFLADTTYHVVLDRDSVVNPIKAGFIIPNSDGRGYGFFKMNEATAQHCMANILKYDDEVVRGSILIHLYENFLNGIISARDYMDFLIGYLPLENNQLLFSQAMGNARSCFSLAYTENRALEEMLRNLSETSVTALRAYIQIVRTETGVDWLYRLWRSETLSEQDAINASYQLAILLPDSCSTITEKQFSMIKNSDRQKQYRFISPAVSADKMVRDSVFGALLKAENRAIEPWAETSLSLLNHPLRQVDALGYIRRGLDVVEEIQKTGDIFFPSAWCSALLGGHSSQEAKKEVDDFFEQNKNYPPKLACKIKQKSHHFYLTIKKDQI